MNTRRKSSILPGISITATKIGSRSTNVDIISCTTTEEKCVREYEKRKSVKRFNEEHYRAKNWIIIGRVDAATTTENLEDETGAMASNLKNQAGKINSRTPMKDPREGTSKQNVYESNAVRSQEGFSHMEIPTEELIQYKGKNKENERKIKKVVRILERPERKLPSALTKKDTITRGSETKNLHNLREVIINVEKLSDETVRKGKTALNEKRGSKDKGKKTHINEGDDEKISISALSIVTYPIKTEKQAKNRKKGQLAKRVKKEEDETWSEDIPHGGKKSENIRRIKGSADSASDSMPKNLKGKTKEEGKRKSRDTVKKESCDQKKVLNGKIKKESTVELRRSQRIQANLLSMRHRK